MARDYKNRLDRTTRSKKKKTIPGWWWLVTGLFIGIFVMVLSDLQSPTTQKPSQSKSTPPKTDVREVKKPVVEEKKPLASEGPRFDFYQILPDSEVVIPHHEIEERRRLEGTGKSKPGTFIIQVGSFKTMAQAETLKAQLALLAVESSIETVNQGGTTWHRVKSGPYDSFRKVDKIQNRLHHNRIDSIAIRLK